MSTLLSDPDALRDSAGWTPRIEVWKYLPETVRDLTDYLGHEPTGADLRRLELSEGLRPDDIAYAFDNLLTTAGLGRLTNLLTGGGAAAMTHAQTIVGVGSSSTAATVADTALGGDGSTSTAYYQNADASYPTVSAGVITCNCTFASGNANFAWQEWCLGIATGTLTAGGTLSAVGTTPIMLNHKVQSLGTKASGAVWTLNAQITIS